MQPAFFLVRSIERSTKKVILYFVRVMLKKKVKMFCMLEQ